MKKYTVFILSFVLFYIVFQILSGWLLTAFYTPELSSFSSNVNQEVVVFGPFSILPFLITVLAATCAYLLSQRLFVTD
ncbi:hypothetical protein SAMN04487944_115133 [Gracilibacillus ureilyticus]|uniref:Uncharacterized protein n=1 Tax=Gracilibacillus ureilyticus TaxID=531814 RepID=A0A1H9U1Z1_9BACI|nr:hypothetical protein [Gracilibacillus ureilyticus]SES03278.1 hypothetical protein SAMN04487944_115133 [Gracilibacillus ureilyticus]